MLLILQIQEGEYKYLNLMRDPSPKNEHFAKSLSRSSIHIARNHVNSNFLLFFFAPVFLLGTQYPKKKSQKACSMSEKWPSLISTALIITLISFLFPCHGSPSSPSSTLDPPRSRSLLHSSWDSIKAPRVEDPDSWAMGSSHMGWPHKTEFSITISPKQKNTQKKPSSSE